MSEEKGTRRSFLRTVGAGATALGAMRAGAAEKAARRPNIIYFVIHDMGKHNSVYGEKTDTPNLERFAAKGVVLEKSFCGAPPCSPSRGCAMTGRYSHTNGLMGLTNRGWSLPVSEKTIVDYLNDAGYETVHTGFQHERCSEELNRYQREIHVDMKNPGACENRLVENVVDNAIGYLKSRKKGGPPFYLNCGTQEVHASLWKANGGYSYLNRTEVYGIDDPDSVNVPAHLPDNRASRDMLARFQGCIRFMDKHFGRLMDAVEDMGYSENTLFVFTCDHGMVATRGKGTVYDRGMEITTLIQMPGTIPAGKRYDHLINNIDFMPTLLEAAGVPAPDGVQGKSFWPLLTGGDYTPQEAIFTERNYHEKNDPIRSVRTKQFHYLRNYDKEAVRKWLPHEILAMPEPKRQGWPRPELPREEEELFDVQNDPQEFINLAGVARYGEVKAELSAKLDAWMEETDDPLLNGEIPDKLNPWPERYIKQKRGH